MDEVNGMRAAPPLLTQTPTPQPDADRRADDLKNAVRRWQQKTAVRTPTPVNSDAEEGLILVPASAERDASLLPPVKIFRAKTGGIPKRQVIARVTSSETPTRPPSSSLAVAVKAAAERSGLTPHPASFTGPMSFEEIMRLKNKIKPALEPTLPHPAGNLETQGLRPRPPAKAAAEASKSAMPEEVIVASPRPPAVLMDLLRAQQPIQVAPAARPPAVKVEAPRPALPTRPVGVRPLNPPCSTTARPSVAPKAKEAEPMLMRTKSCEGPKASPPVRPKSMVARPVRPVARIPVKKAPPVKVPPDVQDRSKITLSTSQAEPSVKPEASGESTAHQSVESKAEAPSEVPVEPRPADPPIAVPSSSGESLPGGQREPSPPALPIKHQADAQGDDPMSEPVGAAETPAAAPQVDPPIAEILNAEPARVDSSNAKPPPDEQMAPTADEIPQSKSADQHAAQPKRDPSSNQVTPSPSSSLLQDLEANSGSSEDLIAQAERLLKGLAEKERVMVEETVAKACDPILECKTWTDLEHCLARVCLRQVQALARDRPS